MQQRHRGPVANDDSISVPPDVLHGRVRAEFLEMPGLTLTLPQASRFFNLETSHCERVLGALVEEGDLSFHAGAFVRTGVGRRYV
jgi:hypothetical protein